MTNRYTMIDIGARLKILRVANNMTQTEFAKKCGVTRASVSSWEKGKTFPSQLRLQKIEKQFGVSLIDEDEYGEEMSDYKMIIRRLPVLSNRELYTLYKLVESLLPTDDELPI